MTAITTCAVTRASVVNAVLISRSRRAEQCYSAIIIIAHLSDLVINGTITKLSRSFLSAFIEFFDARRTRRTVSARLPIRGALLQWIILVGREGSVFIDQTVVPLARRVEGVLLTLREVRHRYRNGARIIIIMDLITGHS